MSNKKYSIIYADPPWSYNDKLKHGGGAERHYKTLSTEKIKQLNVSSIANKNSVLFMWATFHVSNYLHESKKKALMFGGMK